MWLSTSGSHAQPPADVPGDATQYGLLGARITGDFSWGTVLADGRYGGALAGSDGRWLQGDAVLVAGGRAGRVGLRGLVSGFGLRYLDPFEYDAGGVELRPGASIPVGRYVVSVLPRLSLGAWTTDQVEGDIKVAGGAIELQRPFGAWTAVLTGGVHSVENGVTAGTFARAAGDLILDRGRWTLAAELEAQRSPEERELGGGVRATVTVAPGLELQGYAGHRARDPLFGTEGTWTAALTLSVRAVRWSSPEPPPVAAVGEARPEGRLVRFAIRARGAEDVALTGDFTGWDPVPMAETGDGWWTQERVVEPGLHHFGFLVDGQWAIPQDAPGVVEDGWGRRNASIVVEP